MPLRAASNDPESDGAQPRRKRRKSRSPPRGQHDRRPSERSRSQRSTLACERCRLKKLRCTGVHPCSSCQRSNADCDFGERGREIPASQQNLSATNERLSQLEKTVAEVANALNTISQPVAAPHTTPSHSTSQLAPQARDQVFGSYRDFQAGIPPQTATTSAPDLSISPSGDYAANPRAAERLESRWAALQQDAAPFPPLMSHPTAWSEQPASNSQTGAASHSTLGMTQYRASVSLSSEPISEGIVGEIAARGLYTLFFRKCHPTFPLLEPFRSLDSHFDHMRYSSPFLFTAILAIAARYYPNYRLHQVAEPRLPLITNTALQGLAELACAHLGFVLFRKQHQLSDVQAALLLSIWIPRGQGQFADQWMVSGLCTRLAYRIGIPKILSHPSIQRIATGSDLDAQDLRDINSILPQWHTWLILNQYEISLSLGFGRPYVSPVSRTNARQYVAIVRKLGSSAYFDLAAATFAVSLTELSEILTDLINNLRIFSSQNFCSGSDESWLRLLGLMTDLGARLDEWRRTWTDATSYDTINLGAYASLTEIYGNHARLCLNAVALKLVNSEDGATTERNETLISCLGKACEAAIDLVRSCTGIAGGAEPLVRYGGDYFILMLGQAAMFFVRVIVIKGQRALPVDRLVLKHYLDQVVVLLEANDASTTKICTWVSQLCRRLARHAGINVGERSEGTDNSICTEPPADCQYHDWDLDIFTYLNQYIPEANADSTMGGYFDFTEPSFLAPPTVTNESDDLRDGSTVHNSAQF